MGNGKPRTGQPGNAPQDNLYQQHNDAGKNPDRHRTGRRGGLHNIIKLGQAEKNKTGGAKVGQDQLPPVTTVGILSYF
jgi:hypothetical protein